MSAAAPTRAPAPPRRLFIAQPLTGKLWRLDPIAARVFLFQWQDKRRWIEQEQEQEPETFAREAQGHSLVSLQTCPEIPLTVEVEADGDDE